MDSTSSSHRLAHIEGTYPLALQGRVGGHGGAVHHPQSRGIEPELGDPLQMASSGAADVESTLCTRTDLSCQRTKSVKVPPVSIPMRFISAKPP